MPVPTDENSIKMGKIIVKESSFTFKNKTYPFDDICHIIFYSMRMKASYIPIKIEKYGQRFGGKMEIELQLKSSPTKIKTKTETVFQHNAKKYNNFYNGYMYIAKMTFSQRYNGYLSEIEKNRYFTYANCTFFENGRVKYGKKINDVINIHTDDISRTPFQLHLSKTKDSGLSGRLKYIKDYIKSDVGAIIPTTIDQDVFYTLLNELYGLKFK